MSADSGHFYDWSGNSHHFIECKTREGTRRSTIADCRKNNWLPSVTTVLEAMAKPALTQWLINNAVDAVLTTPRMQGESLDDFKARALAKDAQDESNKAKDLGTEIHAAIEEHLAGRLYAPQFQPYVDAAMTEIQKLGRVVASEKTLVHPMGFAGRMDCQCENHVITVLDLKSAKKLPTKESWTEHKLQTAAYAACLGNTGDIRIQTANIYISTTEPGKTATFVQEDWQEAFEVFKAVFKCWTYLNNYQPKPL